MNTETTFLELSQGESFFIKVRTVNFDRISDHQGRISKLCWHDYKGQKNSIRAFIYEFCKGATFCFLLFVICHIALD